MAAEVVETKLEIAELAQIFRDVVKRRPMAAKLSRVQMYTPDFGPYVGVAGIMAPDFAIAVEISPPQGSGGTVVMIVERRPNGSRVVVESDYNAAIDFAGPVRSIRKSLVKRLRSAQSQGSGGTHYGSSPTDAFAFGATAAASEPTTESDPDEYLSINASIVADQLDSSGGSTFDEISSATGLTLVEVSEAIKELERLDAVIRGQGGVYRFKERGSSPLQSPIVSDAKDPIATSTTPESSQAHDSRLTASERIEKLEVAAALLDKGHISVDDFNQLRDELLGR